MLQEAMRQKELQTQTEARAATPVKSWDGEKTESGQEMTVGRDTGAVRFSAFHLALGLLDNQRH